MEAVTIDLDVASNRDFRRSDEFHVLVNILVLLSLKELSFDNTGVLLGWLEDRDGVVREIESNNESSIDIFWCSCVESSSETEDLFVVIHVLEEVTFWLIWEELENITQGVNFISETVVGWDLDGLRISGFRVFNLSDFEVLSILGFVEVMSELINSVNSKLPSKSINNSTSFDFIASQVIVANEVLTWLVHCELHRKFLSLQKQGKGIPTVVGVMHFSDFNSVISKVVVNDEGHSIMLGKESQYLSVIVQKLLLRNDSSSTKCFFQEFFHLCILLLRDLHLSLGKVISWNLDSIRLRLS